MRIGIDVKALSKRYTGIAIYVHDIIRYFTEICRDDEFYLYSNKDFNLNFELPSNFHKIIYRGITGSIGVMYQLKNQLIHDKIDVFWGTEHCLVMNYRNIKQVVTIHDLSVLHNPNIGTRYNALLQKIMAIPACNIADKIIAISHSTAMDICSSTNINSNKIKVIYNGDSPYTGKSPSYNKEILDSVLNKYLLKEKEFYLFVGTIEPRKNIQTIIKAYNHYREKGGTKKLVLAGGLGWRYKPIIEQVELSPYSNDIIKTGYCSDIEKEVLYRNATSLIFPSICEGFGFPIIESMSVGTPVITARNSSLPEVGGNVAYYIDNCYDYTSLTKLMIFIESKNQDELNRISMDCILWAKQFSRKQCAIEIYKLFHNL